MSDPAPPAFELLRSGDEAFRAMLDAIEASTRSVKLEMYIYRDDSVGRGFLSALLGARAAGVAVQVLVDAAGSLELNQDFFAPLLAAGGEVRWFNPLSLRRFPFRNHRKLLVCDGDVAFIGGFNVAAEYLGDGRARGWSDLGLQLRNPLVAELETSFDEMWGLAEFRHRRLARFRRSFSKRRRAGGDAELLLSGPGLGRNPLRSALRADFQRAGDIRIVAAYFFPPLRLRRALTRAARRGRRVQLILAGKSDVPVSQSASRSLYRRLLKADVEIYEYQPQILHGKLVIADDAVYLGSSNLDPRSLDFNYELMVRAVDASLTREASALFESLLADSRRVTWAEWRGSRTWWERVRQRWAYFVVAQFDPFISRRHLRHLR